MALWAADLRCFAALRINHVLIFDARAGSVLRADALALAAAVYTLVALGCLAGFVRRQLAGSGAAVADAAAEVAASTGLGGQALRSIDESDARAWLVKASLPGPTARKCL
jgi:hypothetical protein